MCDACTRICCGEDQRRVWHSDLLGTESRKWASRLPLLSTAHGSASPTCETHSVTESSCGCILPWIFWDFYKSSICISFIKIKISQVCSKVHLHPSSFSFSVPSHPRNVKHFQRRPKTQELQRDRWPKWGTRSSGQETRKQQWVVPQVESCRETGGFQLLCHLFLKLLVKIEQFINQPFDQ